MARQPLETSQEFDFVVVGSGAGGGPLAAGLALAGHRVLVLEAGDDHACPYYSIPIMQAFASEDPDMAWSFFVRHWDDPENQREDRKFVDAENGVLYPRGSSLGGSTTVNALITLFPQGKEWERLVELTGDTGWSTEAMRERFRRLEHWQGKDAEPLPGETPAERDAKSRHGTDGWLGTTRADPGLAGREPKFLDIIGAVERTARDRFGIPDDVPLPRDPNAADTPPDFQGMGFVPTAVDDGVRNGSRERLLAVRRQVGDRLTIRTDALVTRVLFDGDRAVGVAYREQHRAYGASSRETCRLDPDPADGTEDESAEGAEKVACATKEVVLAGGTYNAPQLLMLSGIGPRAELERLGIPVRVDAPGVGRNLHDRYEASVVAELDHDYALFEGSSLNVPTDGEPRDALIGEWDDDHGGPYSTNGLLATIIAESSVADGDSDLMLLVLPVDFHGYYPGYAEDGSHARDRLAVVVLKGHTKNRGGVVSLRSADPAEPPDIRFHYFSEGTPGWQEDLRGMVDGIEIARDVIAHAADAGVARELVPGPEVRTAGQLEEWIRTQSWGHHACGTAKIGADGDPSAVLDGDFRVRGVRGLRVVDASVFPDIPGLFIASAVYLISEKAAETLLAEYPVQETSTARR
ncbi:GMC family oxidoreductase [Streptomyces sp. NPDC091385]|uniref:GMC family oxidoreductase n=1 Tax=Streptomyces sp. NPDC091385 TaxID=3365997 RepID=UPI003810603D